MAEDFEIRAASLGPDAVLDEENNLRVAFLQINLDTFQISFNWLPEFFHTPMPEVLRKEIVLRLRLHADKLESGELERTMQNFANVNIPEAHD